jgi:hypothetical protein
MDLNFLFVPGNPLGFGSVSGHLQLVSQPVATANDAHDAQYGGQPNDNVRNRGAHGWIVQNVARTLLPGNVPIQGTPGVAVPNPAAWGRPLAQSTTPLTPFLADLDPTLDADPLN